MGGTILQRSAVLLLGWATAVISATGVNAVASPTGQDREIRGVGDSPKVDPTRVDQAIRRGVEFLKGAPSRGYDSFAIRNCDELLLLTFVHANVPENEPRFKELFGKMMQAPLERTYNVALQAMVLEELDRVKYQARIHQCAQFLVDNQCVNGQWSYGSPTTYPDLVPVPRDVASGTGRKTAGERVKGEAVDFSAPAAGPRAKPRVVTILSVKKNRDGGSAGDNSNSQYAALGIRACHDAGVLVRKEVIELSMKWWRDSQHPATVDKNGAATPTGPRPPAPPRGWCYDGHHVGRVYCQGANKDHGYLCMTAGAVGALAIYHSISRTKWEADPAFASGIAWLSKNFSVAQHQPPVEWDKSPETVLYYGLYSIERLGMLAGLQQIGPHDWYPEGANAILDAQRDDGSWNKSRFEGVDQSTWDTCFAILFLKRGTRPLVQSVDRSRSKER